MTYSWERVWGQEKWTATFLNSAVDWPVFMNFLLLVSSQDSFGQFYQETIHRQESKDSNAKSLPYSRYFHNKKIKYVWDAGILQFVKFRSVDRVIWTRTMMVLTHFFYIAERLMSV